MTALAAFFALVPMALALGRGSEANAPLGRAVIGGILAGLVTTLFVVPALYSLVVRDRVPDTRQTISVVKTHRTRWYETYSIPLATNLLLLDRVRPQPIGPSIETEYGVRAGFHPTIVGGGDARVGLERRASQRCERPGFRRASASWRRFGSWRRPRSRCGLSTTRARTRTRTRCAGPSADQEG